jgi:Cft2 family RNA processing exonuclease
VSALAFRYLHGGVHLPALGLWLDPQQRQTGAERVFVSHAHSDHIGAHREVILTGATARLMRQRVRGQRIEHTPAFGEPTAFNGGAESFRITLLPAGHILGSAMAFVEADGASLLYTGDFQLRHSLAAEPCDPARAHGTDALLMETTFGRPNYRFPPAERVIEDIVRFCREGLARHETPVLYGYSLGKSQELLCALGQAGLPAKLQEQAYQVTRTYEALGQRFAPYELLDPRTLAAKVLICSPMARRAGGLDALGKVRTAVVTGWAVEPSCRYRYGTDAAFPLSDHADFPELVEFVQQVRPKRIFTLHGFAADFAESLRELGYDARPLSEADQLTLPLGRNGGA